MTETALPSCAEPTPAEPGQPRRWLSDWRVQMTLVVVIALIPRIIYLVQIHRWPFFYSPILDSRTQNNWAEILLRTLGIGNNEVTAKPPLYSYFLALCKLAVGSGAPSLFAARLLQLLLGALTCGLTYSLGRRLFGPAVGFGAGLIMALYSPGVFAEGELLDTALATFLSASFLLALLATFDKPTGPRWFGVGLLLGLLGLTRSNLLLLALAVVVMLLVWLRRVVEREELGRLTLVFLAGVIVPIVPITVRNAILTHAFVPISTNGGINFFTGNNPEADGYSPIPSGIAWERTWHRQRAAVGHGTASDYDRYWVRQGLAFWLRSPGRALALLVKKVYLYWGAYEIPNNLSYDWGRAHASLLRALPFTFAVVGPLGLLGMGLGGWRSHGAWALTIAVWVQVLAVALFFVCGRYRMPAMPALCVFAALAVGELGRMGKRARWGHLGLALGALGALAVLVNADLYRVARARGANRDWYYLGQCYFSQGRYREAAQAHRRQVEANPRDADAWLQLSLAEDFSGHEEAALEALRSALRAAPDYATAAVRLATIRLERGGDLEEARVALKRALASQMNHVQGWAALVRVEVRLGHRRDAEAALREVARALGEWNRADTRYAEAETAAQIAAAEAAMAHIPVPSALRQTLAPPESRMPLVTTE